MLRRIFGPKREEVTREWRKLRNEELNDLYSSSNIVRVIKSGIMSWAEHVACMGDGRGVYRILVGNLRERDPGIDWRIILRWIFRKWDGVVDLAQDRDKWQALVNAVMNFWVP